MWRRHGLPRRAPLLLATCGLHLGAITAFGDEPAARALFDRAVARIAAAREHSFRTGDKTAKAADMVTAIRELEDAGRQFTQLNQTADAVACRLEIATARQFQDQDAVALAELPDIERAAEAAGANELLVRALVIEARLRFYLQKDAAGARPLIEQAVRLGADLPARRWYGEALLQAAEIDQELGDLASAYLRTQQGLGLGIEDDAFVCFGNATLTSICGDLAKAGDRQDVTPDHMKLGARGLAAAQLMRSIAIRHDWTALAKAAEQYEKSARGRLTLLSGRQGLQDKLKTFQIAPTSPRTPADVQVSNTFLVGGPAAEVPAELIALTEAEQLRSSNAVVRVYLQAQLDLVMNKADLALSGFLRAVEMLDREYSALSDETARRQLLAPRVDFYYTPALILLDQHQPERAFTLFEASRGRVLSDLLMTTDEVQLADETQRRVYAQLRATRAKLVRHTSERSSDRTAFEQLEQQFAEIRDKIQRECPTLADLTGAKPVELSAVQQAATTERFDVLAYLCLESQVVIWHIGPSGVHTRSVTLFRTQLADKVTALQGTLTDPHVLVDDTAARELFLFLVQPVLESITTDHLVIIPHGELYRLPFAVLRDYPDGHYLGERFACSYAPSCTILLRHGASSALGTAPILALAGPDLPQADLEVRSLAELCGEGSKAIAGADATPTYLARAARGFPIVHIAAHGKFVPDAPLRSWVQLSPASTTDDGKLTAAQMFALPLDQARLVTLSACQSGQVEGADSGELLGLPRALLYAGARSVLASRWRVDADATLALMRAFYDEARTAPPPQALQRAARRLLANDATAHPYYWAAFQLIGR